LHRLVIRPIKVLSQKSDEISKGDLSARVNIKRRDELGQLSTAFNQMAQSVQEKITELDDQNKKMILELKMAGEVQKSIYPKVRRTKLFDIAIYHKPLMEVSGDYHDIFPLGANRYGILIADVSGHGVAAALITILIRDLFGKSVKKYNDTRDLIRYINAELGNLMNDFQKFFTAFYLIIDENKKIIYSNAGHLKVYLSRPSMNKIFELDTKGFLVGVSADLNNIYESKKTTLQEGDKLIFFTDGIIESLNSHEEQYTTKRLLHSIIRSDKLSCREMLRSVIQDFHKFMDPAKRRDDETLMVLEIKNNTIVPQSEKPV
jgi:sigma-B regulation protein RsbU (phosphoserine phosphatase)